MAAAIARVVDCHTRWKTGLGEARADDFASTSLGDRCWPLTGLPFSHVVAWVNGELMKNTAELGATRRFLSAMYEPKRCPISRMARMRCVIWT